MSAFRLVAVAALLAFVSACAPKPVSLPIVTTPRFPEYVEPRVPPGYGSPAVALRHARIWQFLQAGDLRTAEREAAAVLKQDPSYFPTETAAAYVSLARKEEAAALAQFERALGARADYAPALAGKGLALEASGRNADAVEAFRAAVAVDPTLTDIGRRVEVLTLRSLQDELTAARQAARSGQVDAARRAYRSAITASPDSAFLYREVAAVEREAGNASAALDYLRRAITLDPYDAASLATVGELLEAAGDTEGALKAYADSLAIEPAPSVRSRRDALRARLDLAQLPEQYRAIPGNPRITRGDLAALIGVRLAALLQTASAQDVGVITDIRGDWAERWITSTARAGVLEPFANHTFQPRAVVRRVDLAQAAARLLSLVAAASPAQASAWQGARGRFTDITTGHLAYPAASMAVASGVMAPAPDGAFQPTRVVTGEEAVAAIEQLQRLAGPVATQASGRR